MSTQKASRTAAFSIAPQGAGDTPSGDEGNSNDGIDNIGKRIREARTSAGLSVRGLARDAGVSPSLISQIELGRVQPSVETMYSVANALGITVDTLFTDNEQPDVEAHGDPAMPAQTAHAPRPVTALQPQGVVRKGSHRRIRLAGGVQWELLTPATDPNIEFLRVVYEPGAASCPPDALIRHGGLEYAYIMSGTLGMQIGFDEYELHPGDSVAFRADNPHRLWAIGDEPAVALWVILNRHHDDRAVRS